MTGTGLAQAIPIAITPILTRLYTPEDFGLVALFLACASILSTLATGRYELAITLPDSDKEAANLLVLSLKLCVLTSFVLVLPIMIFNDWIALQLGNSAIAPWLYLLPISVIGIGSFNAIQMWLNRCSLYKQMSMNRFQNASFNAALNVGLGLIKLPSGQIWAATFGPLLAALSAFRLALQRDEQIFKQTNWPEQRLLAHRYQHHPKHILPGQLIGAVAVQLPIIIITNVYSLAIAGFFSLAYRLVVLPTSLIANAIGDVYRQRIAEAYQKNGEFKSVYLKTVRASVLVALPSCALIYLIAPTVFTVVFGKEWAKAGEYAQILVIAVFFQMSFTPIDKGAVLVGATRYILFWHVFRLLSFLALYLMIRYFYLGVDVFLWGFMVVNVILYVLDAVVGYRYAKG